MEAFDVAAARIPPSSPSASLRSSKKSPRPIPFPCLCLAPRVYPATMPIPHRHHARGGASVVFPVFDLLVLFHLRPCNDEASEILEEPGAAGDRNEPAEFPCDDDVDTSVV